MKAVEVSARVKPESGIGVIQRNVYPLLGRRFHIVEASSREGHGLFSSVIGLAKGLLAGRANLDGHFCVVSPLPIRFSKPLVTVVHDLRWQREASRPKRIYRKIDLARVVKHSNTIVCVSETTRKELLEMFPHAELKSVTAWLGPGIVGQGNVWDDGVPGRLLLIGRDPRKRNELVAQILALLPTGMVTSVAGVGVSQETKRLVEEVLEKSRCMWLEGLSDEQLLEQFCQAQYYAHFGTSEGFGLPFVEALKTGTIVIATDQDLTREILGESAILVPDGDIASIAAAWAKAPTPSKEVRTDRSMAFDWASFADVVIRALENRR